MTWNPARTALRNDEVRKGLRNAGRNALQVRLQLEIWASAIVRKSFRKGSAMLARVLKNPAPLQLQTRRRRKSSPSPISARSGSWSDRAGHAARSVRHRVLSPAFVEVSRG